MHCNFFQVNGKNLKTYGSQGQHKTFQVALRFAQFYYLMDKECGRTQAEEPPKMKDTTNRGKTEELNFQQKGLFAHLIRHSGRIGKEQKNIGEFLAQGWVIPQVGRFVQTGH